MRPLCLIVLATAIVFGQTSRPVPQKHISNTVVEAINQVRSSVVQIQAKVQFKYVNPASPPFQKVIPAGSGIVADAKGHIITALHVVNSIESLRSAILGLPLTPAGPIDASSITTTILIGFQMTRHMEDNNHAFGNFVPLKATVLKRSATGDAAILEVSPPDLVKLLILDVMRPVAAKFDPNLSPEGEMIAVSGFPLNLATMVTNVGWIGSEYLDLPEYPNYPHKVLPDGMTEPNFGQLGSLQINEGNSGGPVYRIKDGAVIGIAVAYWNAPAQVKVKIEDRLGSGQADTNSGLCAIVPIREGLALLSIH